MTSKSLRIARPSLALRYGQLMCCRLVCLVWHVILPLVNVYKKKLWERSTIFFMGKLTVHYMAIVNSYFDITTGYFAIFAIFASSRFLLSCGLPSGRDCWNATYKDRKEILEDLVYIWPHYRRLLGKNGSEWPVSNSRPVHIFDVNFSGSFLAITRPGKRLHNYGKIHHAINGTSTISMAIFNSYFDITRGYIRLHLPCRGLCDVSDSSDGTTIIMIWPWIQSDHGPYPLVMTNSSPWYRWPIEIDEFPS